MIGRKIGTPRISWLLGLGAIVLTALVASIARPNDDPDRLWNQANVDFEAGRWSQTETALSRLARLRAPTSRDLMLRAKLYLARNQADEALEVLSLVPDADPLAAQARLVAGQIESKRGRLPAAERLLRAAIAIDPKHIQSRRELIFIFGTQLRRREMNEQFRALSELTLLSFDDLFVWSLSHAVVWDPKIKAELERYVGADPDDRWSRLALAEVLRRLKLLDEAESVLAPLPDSDPDALHLRVKLKVEQLDVASARRLLELGPAEHAGLARLRGEFAMREGDPAAAAKQYRVSARLEPDNAEGISGLARALQLLGDADARPLQERLLILGKLSVLIEKAGLSEKNVDPELPRRLGGACLAAERLDEARSWYALAIAWDPLDRDSQEALYRIRGEFADETAKAHQQPSPRGGTNPRPADSPDAPGEHGPMSGNGGSSSWPAR